MKWKHAFIAENIILIRRFFSFFAFVLVWIASDALFNLSLRTSTFGRYSHFVEWTHYPLFSILGAFSVFHSKKYPNLLIFFLIWCGLDEFLQIFIRNRVPSWLDVFRNIVGLLIGCLIMFVYKEIREKKYDESTGRRDEETPPSGVS